MNKFSIVLIICGIFLFGCEPMERDIFNFNYIKIKGAISDSSGIINLGDTIKIHVRLPDSVSNETNTYFVHSLQKADFAMRIFKVDTINKTASGVPASSYWVSKGNLYSTLSYSLNTNNSPYEVLINFKPQEKGIYYFEVVSQAGDLEFNSNQKARLFVGFATTNNHFELIAQHYPGPSSIQEYIAAFNAHIAKGFGKYAFRVN